jgi:4-carboxymuconolactone decarboxylase
MSRLPFATRDSVPADQVEYFDKLVARYGHARHATVSIMAHVPKFWTIERGLGDYLMKASSLTQDVIDLIFLLAGRELDCQFMWDLHAKAAVESGVASSMVDAVLNRTDPPRDSEKHLTVVQYGRELYRNHNVSYGTFGRARDLFGERGVIELGMMFGRLHMHAILLNSTDADMHADRTEPIMPICEP